MQGETSRHATVSRTYVQKRVWKKLVYKIFARESTGWLSETGGHGSWVADRTWWSLLFPDASLAFSDGLVISGWGNGYSDRCLGGVKVHGYAGWGDDDG